MGGGTSKPRVSVATAVAADASIESLITQACAKFGLPTDPVDYSLLLSSKPHQDIVASMCIIQLDGAFSDDHAEYQKRREEYIDAVRRISQERGCAASRDNVDELLKAAATLRDGNDESRTSTVDGKPFTEQQCYGELLVRSKSNRTFLRFVNDDAIKHIAETYGETLEELHFNVAPNHITHTQVLGITDTGLASLAYMKKLKSCTLSSCVNITPDGLKHLPSTITSLDLSECEGLDLVPENQDEDQTSPKGQNSSSEEKYEVSKRTSLFAGLSSSPCAENLESLSVQGLVYIKTLDGLAHCKSLTQLDLSRCGNVVGDGLKSLRELTKLRSLTMVACSITGEGLVHLPNSIETLNVEGCNQLTNDGFKNIAQVGGQNLKYLNAQDCGQLGDEGVVHIATSAKKLETLIIGSPYRVALSDKGVKELTQLASTLKHLQINGCDDITGDGSVKVLFASDAKGQLNALESLKLSRTLRLTDEDIAIIGECSSLQSLTISHCPKHVTEAGFMKLVEKFKGKSLSFDGCPGVTNAVLKRVSQQSSLSRLDVSFCEKVTDDVVNELGADRKLSVNIENCGQA